jgi:elongation factor P hydroxylase
MLDAQRISVKADDVLIREVFADCFVESHNTVLLGGGDEPFYQPALAAGACHQIVYRADYAASALHEVAHWCIAGQARRQIADYGYWYEPDGRNTDTQRVFESVEVRPQALECLFSLAAGRFFRVSIDNLGGDIVDPFPFQLAVWQQVRVYMREGLPARAEQFRWALAGCFGTDSSLPVLEVTLSFIT